MKNKVVTGIMVLLLLTGLSAFSFNVQTVNAHQVFSDDFDDGDISDWTATTTGDATFDVSTDISVSSPYSLHMKSLGDYKAMGVSPSYSLDLTKDYTVSFHFSIPHTANHWFEVFNNHQIYLVIDSNDDLKCYNGTTSFLISELTTNQWHPIEIKAHPSSSNYDVYVNGTLERTCSMWIHTGLENNFRIGDRADGSTDKGEAYWDDFNIYQGIHDIAVTDARSHKTIVCQGYDFYINVTVENQGNFTETFNVTAYANTTIISTLTDITLSSGNNTTLTFIWNITNFAKGNYTVSANATIVSGETDTADNICIDGTVRVNMAGDVAPEYGLVDIVDVVYVAIHFGAEKGQPQYEPNADINDDDIIDIVDIVIVALHFGETDP